MTFLRDFVRGLRWGWRFRDAERFALTPRGWQCVRCERRWGR